MKQYWIALICLTVACASGPRPALMPHTAPIQTLGINTGPAFVTTTSQYLDFLASQHRPLTLRIPVQSVDEARAVLTALVPYPDLSALLLIEKPDLDLAVALGRLGAEVQPQLQAIECGNELDLFGLTPQQFADFTVACVRAIAPGQVLTGGIYTVDADSLAYAAPMLAAVPCDVIFTVHLYGAASDALLAQLQAAAGCHPIAVTEYGMASTTPQGDLAQAAYLHDQARAFQRLGTRIAILYRLQSGACVDTSNAENFGILRCDGTPKQAAFEVFK